MLEAVRVPTRTWTIYHCGPCLGLRLSLEPSSLFLLLSVLPPVLSICRTKLSNSQQGGLGHGVGELPASLSHKKKICKSFNWHFLSFLLCLSRVNYCWVYNIWYFCFLILISVDIILSSLGVPWLLLYYAIKILCLTCQVKFSFLFCGWLMPGLGSLPPDHCMPPWINENLRGIMQNSVTWTEVL